MLHVFSINLIKLIIRKFKTTVIWDRVNTVLNARSL
jgi:hypothetical protein